VAAADAIAHRGGTQGVELLRWTAAADEDPRVIRAAIDGLSRIAASPSPHAAEAVAAMAAVAADSERRAEAVAGLARVPESMIPRLGEALVSREPSVRRAVLEALGRLAHPTASAYVLTSLEDSDASVRQLAVTILSRLGSRGVARTFAELAESDPSEGVRRAASIALRRLEKGQGVDANPPDAQ
jgi:HEAT repeat protein